MRLTQDYILECIPKIPFDFTELSPMDAMLVNRIIEAHKIVTIIERSYELAPKGNHKLARWCDVKWAMPTYCYRLEMHQKGFKGYYYGTAKIHALEAYFTSGLSDIWLNRLDKQLIHQMLSRKGYCDGTTEFKPIRPLLANLMETHMGYLKDHIDTILDDPVFTESRDRGNSNFLWFLKFQNSFATHEKTLRGIPMDDQKDTCNVLPFVLTDRIPDEVPEGKLVDFRLAKQRILHRNNTKGCL